MLSKAQIIKEALLGNLFLMAFITIKNVPSKIQIIFASK